MPVYNRKQLRQTLGKRYTHDLPYIYTNQSGTQSGSPVLQAAAIADTSLSGQGLYAGAWMYVEGSNGGNVGLAPTMYEYMIATFNTGSGAFLTGRSALDTTDALAQFEIHTRVSPSDKDLAIDDTIKRLRFREEIAIPTTDQALFYDISGAGSPYVLDRILDIHVMTNPIGTADHAIRHVDDWQVVLTATGTELRILHALQGSQQLIFDAILIPSLSGELGTINIQDERWVLSGAAARCYDFMIQAAPAQQVALLQQRRQEHSMEFSRLSTRFMPVIDKPVRLNDIVAGRGGQYPDNQRGWW